MAGGAYGSPAQQTNCHMFRDGHWLFMHNGFIGGLRDVRRDVALAVDPWLFPEIVDTTDNELVFFLSATDGLEEDRPMNLARAVGLVEAVGRRRGVHYRSG